MGLSPGPALALVAALVVSAHATTTAVAPAAVPTAASEPIAGAAVAARIAERLRCREFAYTPGPSTVSSAQGLLTCRLRRQHLDVHVFEDRDHRARGIAHVKLWSGPDTYHFARARRAIVVPRGGGLTPPFTRRWARVAAARIDGAVFSG